jgi:hypothetical protein
LGGRLAAHGLFWNVLRHRSQQLAAVKAEYAVRSAKLEQVGRLIKEALAD